VLGSMKSETENCTGASRWTSLRAWKGNPEILHGGVPLPAQRRPGWSGATDAPEGPATDSRTSADIIHRRRPSGVSGQGKRRHSSWSDEEPAPRNLRRPWSCQMRQVLGTPASRDFYPRVAVA